MKSILVLDYGGQAALVAARKLRGARVFSRVVDGRDVDSALLDERVAGIVVAGGDGEPDSAWRTLTPELFRAGVPVLAMGPASLRMLECFGGRRGERMLFRQAALVNFEPEEPFDGAPMSERFFLEAYGVEPGDDWRVVGTARGGAAVAFRHASLPLYGAQFYVEANDPDGWNMLNSFATRICHCAAEWRMDAFREYKINQLSQCEGDAVISVSGGIDSAVCAELMRRAIGDRLHCVFVDTGLMRKDEVGDVRDMFVNRLRLNLEVVDASERVRASIRGVSSADRKRALIRDVLFDTVAEEAQRLGGVPNLVRGTIYTDVIANRRGDAPEADGAADGKYRFARIIEPLDGLFKEEVRRLGETLNLPPELLGRQPFPSIGLAQRIEGEVTVEKLHLLREADAILSEEISSAGLDRKLYQYFCVLTELKTPGVKAGRPVYERMVAIRAVSSHDSMSASVMRMPYDLLERLVRRIVELPGVNRVVYDMTPTPEAAVEWM